MMILRVSHFFFTMIWRGGGGHGKFPTKMTLSIGGPTIFFRKKKRK